MKNSAVRLVLKVFALPTEHEHHALSLDKRDGKLTSSWSLNHRCTRKSDPTLLSHILCNFIHEAVNSKMLINPPSVHLTHPRASLLGLPPELRQQIFHYYLLSQTDLPTSPSRQSATILDVFDTCYQTTTNTYKTALDKHYAAIWSVCRTLYTEALPVYADALRRSCQYTRTAVHIYGTDDKGGCAPSMFERSFTPLSFAHAWHPRIFIWPDDDASTERLVQRIERWQRDVYEGAQPNIIEVQLQKPRTPISAENTAVLLQAAAGFRAEVVHVCLGDMSLDDVPRNLVAASFSGQSKTCV